MFRKITEKAELRLRFFSGQQIFLKGFSLHPTYFKTSHFEDLKEFAEKYELFLSCISLDENLKAEYTKWKKKLDSKTTIIQSIKFGNYYITTFK
ncbi:hypothetical protein A3Q56_02363 [Intoshia linei]|uniref:Uncharacterized protein n=1 Tax=Intoshia linei TaxID=1819745 RepID=A0A177B8Z2_9BILA|nr:hypothetical protein A3Q56_02363 [Intoshia linei]